MCGTEPQTEICLNAENTAQMHRAEKHKRNAFSICDIFDTLFVIFCDTCKHLILFCFASLSLIIFIWICWILPKENESGLQYCSITELQYFKPRFY